VDQDSGDLTCFWGGNPTADHVYDSAYDGTWSPPQVFLAEQSITFYRSITCFYQRISGYVGLEFTANASNPYAIRFAYLSDSFTETVDPVHDIAVTNVAYGKTVVCQGYDCCEIQVMVANFGDFAEIFNVTVYVDMTNTGSITTIHTFEDATLHSRDTKQMFFTWDTTGFNFGNYTMCAYSSPVTDQVEVADNNCSASWIYVSMRGDLTGSTLFVPDGKCDGADSAVVAMCFGSYAGAPLPLTWYSNCDVNDDNKVDGADIALIVACVGQKGA
jgi:hypothetical protein